MKIWFDTEFLDLGEEGIELLSLGAVSEDNRTFYAERGDCPIQKANDWVQGNVIPLLTGPVMTDERMAREFAAFCGRGAEFWAYYATYDAMLLFKLYGGFMQFPWNQVVHDVSTLAMFHGVKTQPMQTTPEHHALNDALWNKELHEYILRNSMFRRVFTEFI